MIELLAPAGSMDALKAALSAGADAVYLGSALFGARASAGFDEDTLRQAVHLAHLHGRRIHVTVNTLCKQNELQDVEKTLALLEQLHVDAVLIQDLGVLSLCLEKFPHLTVHASTQMALHNASGAAFLQKMGVSRIVLARECTLPEIRLVAQTGIETEVFAHGAMCVSVSGQCLFSSMIGGRSGNRGRCAQPCRLPYTYRGQTKAWLSPCDLCTRDDLPNLLSAGVASLKIEGRLKRPEYVYTVVRAYRQAIDAALAGRFSPAGSKERDELTQIFSRGAFTAGYAAGAQDAGILYPERVTPIGLSIGQVSRVLSANQTPLCQLKLTRPLHDGDGLEIGAQGMIYSGKPLLAGDIATLRLHSPARVGDLVRRTEDEEQLSFARAQYENNALDSALPISFDAEMTLIPASPACLTLRVGDVAAQVIGDEVAVAASKPLDETLVRRALQKTGGTPFVLKGVTLEGENAYLPAASINALRRDGLSALTEALIAAHEAALPSHPAPSFASPAPSSFEKRLFVRTENAAEIGELLAAGADFVLWSPTDYREPALRAVLPALPKSCALCLPPVCEQKTLETLHSLCEEYGTAVSLGSIGQLGLSWTVPVLTDFGVPVTNAQTEALLSNQGVKALTLSPELSLAELLQLPKAAAERILPVYGRARLMTLTHCPERTYLGLSSGHADCTLCEKGAGARNQTLTDRRGFSFPLAPVRLPEGCRVHVLNALPLHLLSKYASLCQLQASWLLTFSTETREERFALLRAYKAALNGNAPQKTDGSGTLGRFVEGVL